MVPRMWVHSEASDSEYEISVGQQIYQLGKGEEHKIVSSKDKLEFDSNLAFVYLYITYLRRDHFQSIMVAISLPAPKKLHEVSLLTNINPETYKEGDAKKHSSINIAPYIKI